MSLGGPHEHPDYESLVLGEWCLWPSRITRIGRGFFKHLRAIAWQCMAGAEVREAPLEKQARLTHGDRPPGGSALVAAAN